MSTSSLSEGALAGRPPAYRLFDSNAVAIATFFGSPVMGSSLMAWNYRRLGEPGKAVLTVLLAVVLTGLVVLIGWNLKAGETSIIALVMLFGMQRIALYLQGRVVSGHVQQGGALGSKWTALWLGVGFLFVVFGVVFAGALAKTSHNSVVIGTKDEVYYSDGATKQDAQALGNALKAGGFFTNKGADVILTKSKDEPVISFVMQDGAWNQPDTVSSLEETAREMAPLVGGFPVKVRLLNTMRDVKKEVTVGEAEFPGSEVVYYQGGITQTQAQTVGESLKAAEYFDGKERITVFVSKDGGIASISFVTNAKGAKQKMWTDPAVLNYFEDLARKAAVDMGGFPIRLQFVDSTLNVKKDIVLTAAN